MEFWMICGIGSVLAAAVLAAVCLAYRHRLAASRGEAESLQRENEGLLRQAEQSRQDAERLRLEAEGLRREAAAERQMREMQETHYRESLETLRRSQQEAVERQIQAIRHEMTAETERILKAREQELQEQARKTFEVISRDLGKDLQAMKESFETNKKEHRETSASLRTRLDEAVRQLREESGQIGQKADRLAEALRGRNKMQGGWGETILNNLFRQEGLVEGRDYDRESTLRDASGAVVRQEETGKRMRPDFILHLPDETDVIVDSKVSLSALADYAEAQDDAAREDAVKRNLESVRNHVRELSAKRYADHLPQGRRSLNYTVMFVPNYSALHLACQADPGLTGWAFQQMQVLIVTEETLMPFLRMIRTAWINGEQIRNQENIIKAAQTMLERVADFAKAHAEMGRKLRDALALHERCDAKIRNSGHSIATAARQIVGYGVPPHPKKPLPLPLSPEEEADGWNSGDLDQQGFSNSSTTVQE